MRGAVAGLLRRLADRLGDRPGDPVASADSPAPGRTPPADWLERVRRYAPQLLRPGEVPPVRIEVAPAVLPGRPEPAAAPDEPRRSRRVTGAEAGVDPGAPRPRPTAAADVSERSPRPVERERVDAPRVTRARPVLLPPAESPAPPSTIRWPDAPERRTIPSPPEGEGQGGRGERRSTPWPEQQEPAPLVLHRYPPPPPSTASGAGAGRGEAAWPERAARQAPGDLAWPAAPAAPAPAAPFDTAAWPARQPPAEPAWPVLEPRSRVSPGWEASGEAAHPWPALPDPEPAEDAPGALALRTAEHERRLDEEQRG